MHISHVVTVGLLMNVQWAHVQLAPPEAPPIGGSGDALGPTYDVSRDRVGDGTERENECFSQQTLVQMTRKQYLTVFTWKIKFTHLNSILHCVRPCGWVWFGL